MNIQRWIARRESSWKRLNLLLNRVEKEGIKQLNSSEIQELASLYRSVSADLARAQTHQVGYVLIQELQQLTSQDCDRLGRLNYPLILRANSTHYERVTWDEVYQIAAKAFKKILNNF